MVKCEICNKEFEKHISLSAHIRQIHKITTKDYYDKYLKKENEGICQICGKQTSFTKLRLGYVKYCSIQCFNKTKVGKKLPPRDEQWKKNISLSQMGHISTKKGKTDVEFYGEKRAKEIADKKSKPLKGRVSPNKGNNFSHTTETKTLMRKSAVERMLLNNGKFPSYNKKACKLFKEFDELNNTSGIFATSPNEFYVKELGYWLDYINFDLKLIIEVDEFHHFEKSGELREKDKVRQKEIQDIFSDFKFLRFKDNEMERILNIHYGDSEYERIYITK